MIHILLLLTGCPAEQLGIEVLAGGATAISAEDLQRDTYDLTRPGADLAAVYTRRMGQMHLEPTLTGEDRVCVLRGEGPARVVAAPWVPGDVPAAVQVATLISVAKGWDGQPPPKRAMWLCLAQHGAVLPEGERVPVQVSVIAEQLEAVDYRVVRDQTAAWFAVIDQ